jgi:hypothetical protein
MSQSFADNWLGVETPKAPEISPPAKPPTLDDAVERQQKQDRTKYRTGRASTRLANAGAPQGRTAAFRLLGGTA